VWIYSRFAMRNFDGEAMRVRNYTQPVRQAKASDGIVCELPHSGVIAQRMI
jgi:hypothetical protein